MHLLKPDMRVTGYPHSAVNEFFCAQLARRVGLPIPNTHFVRVPSACHVIDRVDRDTRTEPAARIHTLDATPLLNKDKSFKYHNANAASLAVCIDTINAKALARLAIFRWSVFNVLIGNADAHLKNLSFFSGSKGYQLAPFYDLVSTVVYHTPNYNETGEQWPAVELSMPMGDARHFSDINRKNVLAFAEEPGLRAAGAAIQLDRLLHDFGDQVARTRAEINEIAQPDAGEIRLLDSIERLPIAEMIRALG